MSIRAALEWAFGVEHARLEYDQVAASSGAARRGISVEAIIAERAALGAVQIDTSPGRSEPADDAQIIAAVVAQELPWPNAVRVANLAKAGTVPDYMPDAQPCLVPVDVVWGRGGQRGRTGDSASLGPEGWPAQPRRNRKGVVVYDKVLFTPCKWAPTSQQIAAARRGYLEWWGDLLTLRMALRTVGLERVQVTGAMPGLRPWAR